MKLLYILIPIFSLVACNSTSNNSNTSGSANPIWDTASAYLIDSIVEEDKSYIPNNVVDGDATVDYPSFILMPYQYHGDEITQGMLDADWYKIAESKLSKSDVVFKRVNDPVVDDDSTQKTGWLVTSSSQNDILIGNVGKLKESKVLLSLAKVNLKAGENHFFTLKGTEYRIYATGYKMIHENGDESYIRNYKVYMERLLKDGTVEQQVLYAHPYFNELDSEVNILFVGDLNKDNKPEIVINRIGYNSSVLILYMSGSNNKELKAVAIHEAIGC